MEPELHKFVVAHYANVKDANQFTHVSLEEPKGKFNITRKSTEEFWKKYQDAVFNNPNMVSCLAERPGYYFPLLNDTDIKIPYDPKIHDHNKPIYSKNQLESIIKIYQTVIKNCIHDYIPKFSICLVLEKSKPTIHVDKNVIGHGFHLHFPYLILHQSDQKMHILERVKKMVDEQKVFENLGITESSTTIDDCTKKCWLLYGSRKKAGLQSYKLTSAYDENTNIISIIEALKDYHLSDISNTRISLTDNNIIYYYPRILSLSCINKSSSQKLRHDLELDVETYTKPNPSIVFNDNRPVPERLEDAKKYLNLINYKRADVYEDWLNIGWILYNTGEGCVEAFDLWCNFSKKTSRTNYYSKTSCLHQWSKMQHPTSSKKLTLGTLVYYAKIDNPDGYNLIIREKINNYADKNIENGEHNDIAKMLHVKYGNIHVCSDIEKDTWYMYKNHRWEIDPKGMALRRKIDISIINVFEDKMKKFFTDRQIIKTQHMQEFEDTENIPKTKTIALDNKIKRICKIIAKLKNNSFKTSVMKECQELFYFMKFGELLNKNPYLIGFTNGVLDAKIKKFRPGEPTDYISLTTKYSFKEDYTWDHPDIKDVNDHFTKVFPDPLLKQYYLEYCANLIEGGNFKKTVVSQTGNGNNAKSVNQTFIKNTLGEYFRTLPTTLITGDRTQSSGATPEMDNIEGIRYVTINEPNMGDYVNSGKLKELSGNDEIYNRGLYKAAGAVTPMFKISIICNYLIKVSFDDPALWERLRVLPYESKFLPPHRTDEIPSTFEEQLKAKIFPQEAGIDEKLEKLKSAFMWIIWSNYKRMSIEGNMIEPDKVKLATMKYRKSNDTTLLFIEEHIVKDVDTSSPLNFNEIYSIYQTWCRTNVDKSKHKPQKLEFKSDLIAKLGECKHNVWSDYRLKNDADDSDDESENESDNDENENNSSAPI